ncbi:hypothetical protein IFM89_024583 [Coptis chinensis]|uniref:Lipoxygenase domain-containing protein n=1 Tax=Coptis chinensis TaxID=261450 RepID=A0A835LWD4_9MAGN|nr:hypothetical protein IFM89_024583 [Coptis chinensis]
MEDSTCKKLITTFDDEAEYLLQRPLDELLKIEKKENGFDLVSEILEEAIGKEYEFEVRITKYNCENGKYSSLTVLKLDKIEKGIKIKQENEEANAKKQCVEIQEYCSFYYPSDVFIQGDSELQSWWAEIHGVGHGDKKNEPWLPKMQTVTELTESCTIIIWLALAFHAEILRLLYTSPAMLCSICFSQNSYWQCSVAYIFLLPHPCHTQRDTPEWTSDVESKEAFKRFRDRLVEIENRIEKLNKNMLWRNRVGPVNVPYTLLYPSTSDTSRVGGHTGRGIPNSVSI